MPKDILLDTHQLNLIYCIYYSMLKQGGFYVRANSILGYSETNIHAGLQKVYKDNV